MAAWRHKIGTKGGAEGLRMRFGSVLMFAHGRNSWCQRAVGVDRSCMISMKMLISSKALLYSLFRYSIISSDHGSVLCRLMSTYSREHLQCEFPPLPDMSGSRQVTTSGARRGRDAELGLEGEKGRCRPVRVVCWHAWHAWHLDLRGWSPGLSAGASSTALRGLQPRRGS